MRRWRLTVFWGLAWLGMAGGAVAAATAHPALTFAVDYRLGQETVDAAVALGDKRGEVVPAGRPLRFDLDPLSTQQDGLQVGAGRAGVVYRTAGHLTPERGTLEMLLKNLDWEWQDGEMHLFLSSYGASPLTLYVYKHGRDGLGVYLRRQGSGESLFLRQ